MGLTTTFRKMGYRGGDNRTHEFLESFLVIAYFRIPGFREVLLDQITKKSYDKIEEWRGVDVDLNKDDV